MEVLLPHFQFLMAMKLWYQPTKVGVIRVAAIEIRTAGRNTQGVRIIKLSGDEKVVSSIKIDDNLI